jgi:hypothetical protein
MNFSNINVNTPNENKPVTTRNSYTPIVNKPMTARNSYTNADKDTLGNLVEKKVEWSNENEKILVEWGDIAACNKWLHTESCKLFTRKNAYFTIPIIIISTITGTISFIAVGNNTKKIYNYLQMGVGSANIIIGVMSTIHQFLNIAELKEKHRAAYIMWDKLYRNIRVELAKAPKERTEANRFIKLCRQEYDRLTEISPIISPSIVRLFFKIFSGEPGSEQRRRFELLKKPDVCNSLVSLDETRLKWFDNKKHRFSDTKRDGGSINDEMYNDNNNNNVIILDDIYCPSPVPNFKQFGNKPKHSMIDNTVHTIKTAFFKEPEKDELTTHIENYSIVDTIPTNNVENIHMESQSTNNNSYKDPEANEVDTNSEIITNKSQVGDTYTPTPTSTPTIIPITIDTHTNADNDNV